MTKLALNNQKHPEKRNQQSTENEKTTKYKNAS